MTQSLARALIPLVASACADVSRLATVTVVDSAGIRIVVNEAGRADKVEEWALSQAPTIAVGSGEDPVVALFRIVAVTPLSVGRVAIGMTAPPRVLIVDSDGTEAAVLGREGDGPGEFAGVGSVVRIEPDSLAVWDPERRRVSVFTEDGQLQREVNLSDLAPLSWIASPNVLSESARTYLLPSAPRSLVLFAVGVFGPGEGIRRVAVPSYRITADGAVLEELGAFPGETTFSSDQTGVAPYPLGPDTHVEPLGDRLIVGTADQAEFRRYSPTGELEQIVRWVEQDTTVAGPRLAHWTEFLETWLGGMSPQEASSIRELLDAMPEPERFPAYTGVITSDSGEIWVGTYHPGQLELAAAYMGRLRLPARRWLVFDEAGSMIATIRTPAGFRAFLVEGGRVWGVHTDEFDVESVQAYEVLREQSGA